MGRAKSPEDEKRIRKTVYLDPEPLKRLQRWEALYRPNHDFSSILRIVLNAGLAMVEQDPSVFGALPMRASDAPSMGTTTFNTNMAKSDEAPPSADNPVMPPPAGKKPKGPKAPNDPLTREASESQLQKNLRAAQNQTSKGKLREK